MCGTGCNLYDIRKRNQTIYDLDHNKSLNATHTTD